MRRILQAVLGLVPIRLRPTAELARQVADLIAMRRFGEADDLAAAALRSRPRSVALLEQHAFSAHNSGRYALAHERWERLRHRDPTHAMAWTAVACNLREMGRCEEAGQVALEASTLFPKDLVLTGELSRIFLATSSRALKTELLPALRLLCSDADDQAKESFLVEAELSLGHLANAKALVDDLLTRHPGSVSLLTHGMKIALQQSDWRQTILMVEELRSRAAASDVVDQHLDAAVHGLVHDAEQTRASDPTQSLRELNSVWRHGGQYPDWLALRVDVLIRLDRLDEAEHDLDVATNRLGARSKSSDLAKAAFPVKRDLLEIAQRTLAEHLLQHPGHRRAAEFLNHVETEWLLEQAMIAADPSRPAALHNA